MKILIIIIAIIMILSGSLMLIWGCGNRLLAVKNEDKDGIKQSTKTLLKAIFLLIIAITAIVLSIIYL